MTKWLSSSLIGVAAGDSFGISTCPQESVQPERKSTPRSEDDRIFIKNNLICAPLHVGNFRTIYIYFIVFYYRYQETLFILLTEYSPSEN